MQRTFLFAAFFSIFCGISARSQDFHLSQFNALPAVLNPATTGFMPADIRLSSAVRNQWAPLGKGYNTFVFSGEWLPIVNRRQRNGMGVGFCLQRDYAGALAYGQTLWTVSTSFFHSFDHSNRYFLSLGLQAGKAQRGFDPSEAVFGNTEWAGVSEDFSVRSLSYFDISTGMYGEWHPQRDRVFGAGLSVFHWHEPELSFLGSGNVLPRRWVAYASGLFRMRTQNGIRPAIYYQRQSHFQEILFGGDWLWYLDESPLSLLTLMSGLYYRWGDAMVVLFKTQYRSWTFGLSYDVNFSSLSRVSHSYGAVEFTASYMVGAHRRHFISHASPCSLF